MFRSIPFLTCFCCLILTLAGAAQEGGGEPRTVRFLFLNAPAGAPAALHLFDGRASREVELPRMNLSDPYPVPAGPLRLRLLGKPAASPEEVPAKAPSIVLPAEVIDAYLLVSSDPSNTVAPVRVQVVDARQGGFRNGQILWFNLTPHEVAGRIGVGKVALKPRSSVVSDAPAQGRESYPVVLSYKPAGDDRIHPICETSWLHDPRSRKLAFVFEEPGRRAPRVLAFVDHRPPKTKP